MGAIKGEVVDTTSERDAACDELRKLEVEHTALMEQLNKLQLELANTMLANKQLKGAVARLDGLVTYLLRSVASLPVKPRNENEALNTLAHALRSTQDRLSKATATQKSKGDADSTRES